MGVATVRSPAVALLALSFLSSASSARLELLQTESHLLPTSGAGANHLPKAELDAVMSPAEAAAATMGRSKSSSQRTGHAAPHRVLVEVSKNSSATQQPPTVTQRLMHPFRVLAAEQLLNGGAAQLQPLELVMTCSVVGMGVVGAIW